MSDNPAKSPEGQGRPPSSVPLLTPPRTGRAPSTSLPELENICLDLFTRRGLEATSIEDIAAAAGIGRRTFFRYFPSKNDAVWGDFDGALGDFEAWFLRCPAEIPLMTAIRLGVVAFNTYDRANEQAHRDRMMLILSSDALQAHSTLRYDRWRQIVAGFAARRMDCRPQDLAPRVTGHLALGAALAAYEQWLADEGSDLLTQLNNALSVLEDPSALEGVGARR